MKTNRCQLISLITSHPPPPVKHLARKQRKTDDRRTLSGHAGTEIIKVKTAHAKEKGYLI